MLVDVILAQATRSPDISDERCRGVFCCLMLRFDYAFEYEKSPSRPASFEIRTYTRIYNTNNFEKSNSTKQDHTTPRHTLSSSSNMFPTAQNVAHAHVEGALRRVAERREDRPQVPHDDGHGAYVEPRLKIQVEVRPC